MNRANGSATRASGELSVELRVDGLLLAIDRLENGRWQVVYGGFSRAVSDTLLDAIAVATGVNSAEPWVRDIARSVGRDVLSKGRA